MFKYFVSLLFTSLLFSCGTAADSTDSKVTEEKSFTLVFFDKTQSVNVSNEFVKNKYLSALKAMIDKNINAVGDKLDVYYIHENTSKAKCLSLVCRTEKEDMEGLSATDQEAAGTNYEMSIKKERKMMLDLVLQKMMEKNTGSSNLETNITASIPLIASALSNTKNVDVFYFSDMIESVKAGRDFHKNAPISDDQAKEWATEDASKNAQITLNNAKINVILPFQPTSSSKENNPAVTEYWREYFYKLGVSGVEEI